ncbi:hypothetical protein LRP49_14915 [Enterovibrio sp. ZSDZ35]|uniref:Lipoprotein n=1 Tax=Enterovibrio qingdaonensis TaxID=2899818 RepID=A0ABT5QQ92_9GAMM|nr:hypothetical protein [Enterovibrio sp. ZSDZ35]MDD1782461.1 hypothetical protein [Enterovibrio sp. ZSDZ35]
MKCYLQGIILLGVTVLTGCVQTAAPHVEANGSIQWASGVNEAVHVAAANEHLVFVEPSFLSKGVVIYSRIIGAGTPDCEYYVNEPMPLIRLTICGDGNVELLDRGQTINVGKLAVFES